MSILFSKHLMVGNSLNAFLKVQRPETEDSAPKDDMASGTTDSCQAVLSNRLMDARRLNLPIDIYATYISSCGLV